MVYALAAGLPAVGQHPVCILLAVSILGPLVTLGGVGVHVGAHCWLVLGHAAGAGFGALAGHEVGVCVALAVLGPPITLSLVVMHINTWCTSLAVGTRLPAVLVHPGGIERVSCAFATFCPFLAVSVRSEIHAYRVYCAVEA